MPGPHLELTAMTEALSDLVRAGKKMARAILDAEANLTSASSRDFVNAGETMAEAITRAEALLTPLEAVSSQAILGYDEGDGGLRTPQHLADTTGWPRWRGRPRSRSR